MMALLRVVVRGVLERRWVQPGARLRDKEITLLISPTHFRLEHLFFIFLFSFGLWNRKILNVIYFTSHCGVKKNDVLTTCRWEFCLWSNSWQIRGEINENYRLCHLGTLFARGSLGGNNWNDNPLNLSLKPRRWRELLILKIIIKASLFQIIPSSCTLGLSQFPSNTRILRLGIFHERQFWVATNVHLRRLSQTGRFSEDSLSARRKQENSYLHVCSFILSINY